MNAERIYLQESVAKFPELLVINECRKAFNLLRKVLLTTSRTWPNSRRNIFIFDPSFLAKHYPELFGYRPAQSDVTLNATELSKDKNLTL